MKNIGILYYSGSGHTEALAKEIEKGASSVSETKVNPINVGETIDWKQIHDLDGLVFGSPTYMGGVAAQFKTFMDETSSFWAKQSWKDKYAAGFTIGTCPSGDKLNCLMQMVVFSMQHAMIWIGQGHLGSRFTGDGLSINETGSYLGLSAQSNPKREPLLLESDIRTANLFGKRVAEIVKR